MPIKSSKRLATWDASRQQQYRGAHPEHVEVFHVLLDASGSMTPHEAALRASYNQYLRFLQREASPMALLDLRLFGSRMTPRWVQGIRSGDPLTSETYSATHGETALYDALGVALTTAPEAGQHILLCFSDGEDVDSETWTAAAVAETLRTLQAEAGWLALYLGAHADALEVGIACGFVPGNCLEFRAEVLGKAFETLRTATQRYLAAPPPQRRLLAAGGVFVP